MQTPASQGKAWRKTNAANLYMHRNGGYYFRATVGGKQLWQSLRTKLKSVAEARAAEKHRTIRAGISHLTHHDLRHLCATTLIERGIDIPTVARLLGHKDGGTLAMRTYGHLRDEHAQKVVARVSYSDQTFSNLVSMAEASQRKERLGPLPPQVARKSC
jgi:integrase